MLQTSFISLRFGSDKVHFLMTNNAPLFYQKTGKVIICVTNSGGCISLSISQ